MIQISRGLVVAVVLVLIACGERGNNEAAVLTGLEPVDKTGYTGLHHAAANDDADKIREILSEFQGLDVDNRGNLVGTTALEHGVAAGSINAAKALLEHGAFVDGYATLGPLHRASSMGSVELAALLIQHSATINKPDKWGRTALHLAARKGHLDVCAF